VLLPVAGEFTQRGAAGDECRVNAQLVGAGVAAPFQIAVAADLGLGRAMAFRPQKFRMPLRRKLEAGFNGISQGVAAAR